MKEHKLIVSYPQEAALEAILYVAGDEGISFNDLAKNLQQSLDETKQLVAHYQQYLTDDQQRGLQLHINGNHVRLTSKASLAPLLKRYYTTSSNSLSQAALEVLAIIAYQQPITRIEIDEIRGVQSSSPVQTLVTYHLIKEKGRKDVPGRPILYGTTDEFLNYFDLHSLADLPDITKFEQQNNESAADNLEDTAKLLAQFEKTLKDDNGE